MEVCSVLGCSNSNPITADTSVHYYFFPTHPTYARKWVQACGWHSVSDAHFSSAKICSIHFDANSYTQEINVIDFVPVYTKLLKFDAIPTLYLPTTRPENEIIDNEGAASNKGMIVFAVPPENSEQKEYIELHVEDLPQVSPVKIKTVLLKDEREVQISAAGDEKNIQNISHLLGIPSSSSKTAENNISQLLQIQKENKSLKYEIEHMEKLSKHLQANEENNRKELEQKDEELEKIKTQYYDIRHSNMPLSKQAKLLSKVFSESQLKILAGKKKIYWSDDDMAVGYTIRQLSGSRCYEYLTKNMSIPLPAVSSMKRWLSLKGGGSQVSSSVTKKEEEDTD